MDTSTNPALVLIDVQRGIDEASHWGGNRNNIEAEHNIDLLLQLWRRKKLPVIIVQHCAVSTTSPFYPGRDGNSLKDFVNVLPDEKLIQKSTTSAFIKTDLLDYLRMRAIKKLFITGFVTNNSVEATARNAGDLGFETVVIADATACFNKKGRDGSKYDSHLIHQISLSNLEGEYASILTTKEVIKSV